MWPKNSCALQLRVIVCVILLIGVRVINVFVPLLTKEISKFIKIYFQRFPEAKFNKILYKDYSTNHVTIDFSQSISWHWWKGSFILLAVDFNICRFEMAPRRWNW